MAADDLFAPPTPQEHAMVKGMSPAPTKSDDLFAPPTSQEHASVQGMGDKPSKLPEIGTAALEHFGQGATLGYMPQLQAMAEPAMNKALDLFTGNHVSDDDDSSYVQRRDENSHRIAQEMKDHPYASVAGTIAGGLTSGIAMSPALAAVPGLSALSGARAAAGAGIAARTAALGARTAGAMGQSFLMGAAANPGDTEGEVSPLQLGDRAKNALMTSILSAPLHLGGEAVAAGGSYLGGKAKDLAEKLAYRALGPRKRFALQDADNVQDIGRAALDNGIVTKMPTNAEGLAERASEAVSKKGEELGAITDELSGLENQATSSGMPRKVVADNLRQKLIQPSEIPAVQERNAKMGQWIDEFENGGDPNLSFQKLRELKTAVGGTSNKPGLIKWDRLPNADVPLEEQFHRALYTELKNGEDSGAQALEHVNFGPDSNRFQTAKDEFGNLKAAQRITDDKAGAEKANQILGLKDTIAGGVGAGIGAYAGEKLGGHEGMKVGAAIGGGVGAMGNKLARTYGSQVSARSADALSQLLMKAPELQALVAKNPAVLPVLAQRLLQKDEPKTSDDAPDGISPDVLGMVKKNPQLIDSIQDEQLKDQLRKYVKRKPAEAGSGYNPDQYLNKDDAKKNYLDSN